MTDAATLSGPERAAIFLMSLSEKDAAQVMKHMPVGEIQRLGKAMAKLRGISRDQAEAVLQQFTDNVQREAPIAGASPSLLKRLLSQSLGEDKARTLLDRLVDDQPQGLDSLQLMDPKEVAELIHREHPQVIAIVLAGLEPAKAALVLAQLPASASSDIIARIGRMNEIPQSAIEELDQIMQQRFSQAGNFRVMMLGGVRSAAEILNLVGKDNEQQILEKLDELDQALSEEIRENMLVFDNLLELDDRGMQSLLREISTDVLVLALKGAEPAMHEKVYANMSKRAVEILRSDLEAKGPVRVSEVEAAQKEMINTARRLAEEGTLVLGTGGDEFL
ncbi:MAG: flagellar motor switch protein FliG [Chromatiales bacterium]|nr:flagellar motor switch protein FliG [Chromatiales bacterium]